MATPKPDILILVSAGTDAADVTDPLAERFVVHTRPAWEPAMAVLAPAVVLVVVESLPELAVASTRRLRADTTAAPVPVLWLLSPDQLAAARDAFDAGADACLVRPADPGLLVAQVNALLRTRRHLDRFAARGADAHDLTGRLEERFRRADTDAALARTAAAAFHPRGPVVCGSLTVAWVHRPANRGPVGTFDVVPGPDGRLRFLLAEVGGAGGGGGVALLGGLGRWLVRELLAVAPEAALLSANARLREFGLPDAAVVAAAVGVANADTGEVTVACGGLPAPVLVPAAGPAVVWHGSGPFLATTDGPYFDTPGALHPGDKLVLMAGGAGADRRPDVREMADRHRHLPAAEFAEVVAKELVADAHPDDGFTLLVIERASH